MIKKSFNLIDEPWIPAVNAGSISLREVFTCKDISALGGTPVQKIVITKLLLTIAQAAATPKDDNDWQQLGPEGLARACDNYLTKWHDRFYLYGNQPFLQLPAVLKAKEKSYGTFMPDIASGNNTLLTEHQIAKPLENKDKALVLITQMSMALGGKQTDHSLVLTPGYTKKKRRGASKPGPGLSKYGLLHTFVLGDSLQQTIWLNLLTEADLQSWNIFAKGVGKAPWEKMPEGENCATAQDLQQSLMGRLVPLCRFCLLKENGIHVTEGIQHLSHKDGMFDPSITLKKPEGKKKERKVIWADPNKRPWRELTGLLSFINGEQDCFQLYFALPRAFKFKPDQQNMYAKCDIWSGGFRVSSNAGEQYATGTDDVVEAHYAIPSKEDRGSWFDNFKQEMSELEALAKKLYGRIIDYFEELTKKHSKDKKDQFKKKRASAATAIFWQLCESQAQALLNYCDNINEMNKLRQCFSGYLLQTYDQFCFGQTAKQLNAWAKCRPNTAKYIANEEVK